MLFIDRTQELLTFTICYVTCVPIAAKFQHFNAQAEICENILKNIKKISSTFISLDSGFTESVHGVMIILHHFNDSDNMHGLPFQACRPVLISNHSIGMYKAPHSCGAVGCVCVCVQNVQEYMSLSNNL